jgi:hypothetical protein
MRTWLKTEAVKRTRKLLTVRFLVVYLNKERFNPEFSLKGKTKSDFGIEEEVQYGTVHN